MNAYNDMGNAYNNTGRPKPPRAYHRKRQYQP